MLRFLLNRPVSVLVTFLALTVLGGVALRLLPVGLLPDIAIPKIVVQMNCENMDAEELENTVVSRMRQQLLQLSRLNDISSQTCDGISNIYLQFEFGTNTDLAFIEVNEKIDAAMSALPKNVKRPKVIKSNATDMPIFYLQMTCRDETAFTDMALLANNVVRRRLEQLQEVSMVDVTGIPTSQIEILPDVGLLAMYGLQTSDIGRALAGSNIEVGSLLIHDGYYEYSVAVGSVPRTIEELGDICMSAGSGRVLHLRDICHLQETVAPARGLSVYDGKRAVTLAVIKHPSENIGDVRQAIQCVVDDIAKSNPEVNFAITHNQTELLEYSISSLRQNLILGFLFVFLVVCMFMGGLRSPLVIAITMLVSLIVTFLGFWLFDVSINVISLSGLILAVGMMIDNSIIVSENIAQHLRRGEMLFDGVKAGVREMIAPMLSSTLTTVAVFVPLVFMSGIAGVLFYDEAFSISMGLIVSYFSGIILLPVVYLTLFRDKIKNDLGKETKMTMFLNRKIEDGYTRMSCIAMNNKKVCLSFFPLALLICWIFFESIDKVRMPHVPQKELVARISWNEPINVETSRSRVTEICDSLHVLEYSAFVGMQDFMIDKARPLNAYEVELYLKVENESEIQECETCVRKWLLAHAPMAEVVFRPEETIFERLFDTGMPEIEARLHCVNESECYDMTRLLRLEAQIKKSIVSEGRMEQTAAVRRQVLLLDRERMLLYGISTSEVEQAMRSVLKSNRVMDLRSSRLSVPVILSDADQREARQRLQDVLLCRGGDSLSQYRRVPFNEVACLIDDPRPQSIFGGKSGVYVPFFIEHSKSPEADETGIRHIMRQQAGWSAEFAGSIQATQRMQRELIAVLCVSLLLMFFILSAQFGNLKLPLIVLMEIPIDTGFALFVLYCMGQSLNLMSAIGIIASHGIVINDSILKLDAIRHLRQEGRALADAIHEAGVRRLRPIVMTSLTTLLTMVPMLIGNDLGTSLQRPLAIAMIATMVIGTVVSLVFVPVAYYVIESRKNGDLS